MATLSSDTSLETNLIVDDADFDRLRQRVRGSLIRPSDTEYDVARSVWNGMIDKRPRVIVRCAGVADVVAAIEFGREHSLPVAVRGGGHNIAGIAVCDEGLVIDLSAMKSIRVDEATRTVRAEGGTLWGDFDHETQAFGLATTGGTVSTTGIAGLTLGGGVGWLMGAYGATCDNLIAADMVTADGRCVRASTEENPDLLWGLRGGGGNFGVVTSFEYQLHALGPTVVGGMVVHPMSKAREVLRFYREFTAQAPDELTVYAAFLTSPDRAPITVMAVCYAGSIADGERAVARLRAFGPPAADMIGAMPYQAHQKSLDPLVPAGRQGYWKGHFLRDLTDDAIDTIVDHVERMSSPHSIALLEHAHGAITRVGPTETAFPHRTSPYDLVVLSQWDDPNENDKHIAWTRGLFDATRSFSDGGIYVNVLNAGEEERLRAAYGPNCDRLASLKQKYDPTNFFRMNHNIRPM